MIAGVWCPTLTVYGIYQTLQLPETVTSQSAGCTADDDMFVTRKKNSSSKMKVKLVLDYFNSQQKKSIAYNSVHFVSYL